VYTKVSIFFNFGTTGASSGEQTYYWDDVDFGNGSVVTTSIFEIIANSPQHTILEDLIILAGLNLLLTAPVLFTVFAPTDAMRLSPCFRPIWSQRLPLILPVN
jgi:hypothetical protein